MKHDHAYSKHFKDDISPEQAYDYFHSHPLKADEFRCDKYCPVPVTLVNVRKAPEEWGVPPYFKYRSGYDDKHSNLCPNVSKITKVTKHPTQNRAKQTYKPSDNIIIELPVDDPMPYENVGTFQQPSLARKGTLSSSTEFESPMVKRRSRRLLRLASAVNLFHSHPGVVVNFNGTLAPLNTFFQELRYGNYKLSLDRKIYHGKAFAKKVKNKNGKELILLEFNQKCQLENAYFEKPAVFIEADALSNNSQHQKLLKYCQSGEPFHLYVWGSFFVTSNSKIRVYKTDNSDHILLGNLYFEDWSE